MSKVDRNTAPIYLMIDRVIVGYISALTKTDVKLVLCNLRDMSQTVITRLQERDYGDKTWTYITYPGVEEMKLKVNVVFGHNYTLSSRHRVEWENKFQQETGIIWPKKRKDRADRHRYFEELDKWRAVNPDPNLKTNYESLMVSFEYKPKNSDIMMSQDEIDTVLVENFLLTPQTESDDE